MAVHCIKHFYKFRHAEFTELLNPTNVFFFRKVKSKCLRHFSSFGVPRLSPQEVTTVLQANETSSDIKVASIKSYDCNQLASNNPIEDRLAIGHCNYTTGYLFGVFDGHGGVQCVDQISNRLLDYIAVSLLPFKVLEELLTKYPQKIEDLVCYNFQADELTSKQREIHINSLKAYAKDILSGVKPENSFQMNDALCQAFKRLDDDLSEEIQSLANQEPSVEVLSTAVMGSCACVIHIDGNHLHLASTGDCKAVVGSLTDDGRWHTTCLHEEHNADNISELKRIIAEHPKNEVNSLIKYNRLLGQLAPLRAFGDYNFKWPMAHQRKFLLPFFGPTVTPKNYYTPPYLTAVPEINYHQLTAKDKFIIIASDGLWELMLPYKVVNYVGQHMVGKQVLDPLRLPRENMKFKDIKALLEQRKAGLSSTPIDINSSTHLIRNALGRTETGIDHSKLATMLSLPDDIVRNIRDDLTIIVIYLNPDYMRELPANC